MKKKRRKQRRVAFDDKDPCWGIAYRDNRIEIAVNPFDDGDASEIVLIELCETGNVYDVPLSARLREAIRPTCDIATSWEWELWAAGAWRLDARVDLLDREIFAEAMPKIFATLPTAASLVSAVDWAAKAQGRLTAEQERHSFMAVREQLLADGGEDELNRQLAPDHPDLSCPFCGVRPFMAGYRFVGSVLGRIKFDDDDEDEEPIWVCHACGWDFSDEHMLRTPPAADGLRDTVLHRRRVHEQPPEHWPSIATHRAFVRQVVWDDDLDSADITFEARVQDGEGIASGDHLIYRNRPLVVVQTTKLDQPQRMCLCLCR